VDEATRDFIEARAKQPRYVDPNIIREILTRYMATPEGREKVLASQFAASRMILDMFRKKMPSVSWRKSAINRDCVPLLAVIPLDERESEAYRQLFDLVEQAKVIFGVPRAMLRPIIPEGPVALRERR
jgi:hypothetical protein